MKSILDRLCMVLAISAVTLAAQSAQAQTPPAAPPTPATPPAGPAYGVSYIEAVPGTSGKAMSALRTLRAAARKADGSVRFEILQRRERPNHFAIMEIWKDYAAFQANLASDARKKFRDNMQPLQAAGHDERLHTGLAVGEVAAGSGAKGQAVYAVTHVDFIPPKKDEGIAALQALATPSRSEAGNLRYEVQQQNSRPNHLTLFEVWKDHKTLEAHESAEHTKRFREALVAMSGALFDQRLYRAID